MNFISTIHWWFDTNMPMSVCIPLKDDWDNNRPSSWRFFGGLITRRNDLMTDNINKDKNDDLLQEFYDWQEKEYDRLQDGYNEHLRDLWYWSTEWVEDGYQNFCLDWYKEEMPSYKIPLLSNDRC